jgi:hypothetical protein
MKISDAWKNCIAAAGLCASLAACGDSKDAASQPEGLVPVLNQLLDKAPDPAALDKVHTFDVQGHEHVFVPKSFFYKKNETCVLYLEWNGEQSSLLGRIFRGEIEDRKYCRPNPSSAAATPT